MAKINRPRPQATTIVTNNATSTAPTPVKTVSPQPTPEPAPFQHQHSGKLSVLTVISDQAQAATLAPLAEALKAFAAKWTTPLEIVLVNNGGDTALLKPAFVGLETLKNGASLQWLESPNTSKTEALRQAIGQSSGDHILVMDAQATVAPLDLIEWLKRLPEHRFDDQTVLIGSRAHTDSTAPQGSGSSLARLGFNLANQYHTLVYARDVLCDFKLYPRAVALHLFAYSAEKNAWLTDVEILQRALLDGIRVQEMPVRWQQQNAQTAKPSALKGFFQLWASAWRTRLRYFFTLPFRENRDAPALNREESPLYRFFFAALALVLLGLMLTISGDYGLNGDEHLNKQYGDYLVSYYESGGKDESALNYKNLYYYGGLFDWAASWFCKYVVPNSDPYDTRHFLNAIVGWMLMLYTGLLGRLAANSWRVGFLSLLFIALSPRIFGDAIVNPKDIPFATCYIFAIYHLLHGTNQLPNLTARTVLMVVVGIAASINIRIGGLILIAYSAMFLGGALLWRNHLRPVLLKPFPMLKMLIWGAVIIAAGYLGGLLFWPYGALSPLKNPFKALAVMSNFDTGIRILFNDQNTWSDRVQWDYIPTWFWYTTPIFVWLAVFLSPIMSFIRRKQTDFMFLFAIWFSALFPIFYAIFKKSALYDGMRHFLFAYALLPILGAWAVSGLLAVLRSKPVARYAIGAGLTALMALPAWFMIKNHPYQYVYFNELMGGIKNAYGKYETDYWMIGIRRSAEWLLENEPKFKTGQDVRIATNCYEQAVHHFLKYPNAKVFYVRYHDRAKEDWEYGIFYSRFINRKFLQNGVFPSVNTVHREEIDGIPLSVVVKRDSSYGYQGAQLLTKGDVPGAIAMFEKEIAADTLNESAYMQLVQIYSQLNDLENMRKYAEKVLSFSDEYENALGMLGVYYMAKNDFVKARPLFEKALSVNYKYTFAHFQLGRMLAQENKYPEALRMFELFDQEGGQPTVGYDAAIEVAQLGQDRARMLYFQAKKAALANQGDQAYQFLLQCLGVNPKYAPAVKLKNEYDEAIRNQRETELRKKRLGANGAGVTPTK